MKSYEFYTTVVVVAVAFVAVKNALVQGLGIERSSWADWALGALGAVVAFLIIDSMRVLVAKLRG